MGVIMSENILELIGITKEFPGVKALSDVSFKIKKGDSLALLDGKLVLVSKNHFESIKQVLKKFTSNCESIDVYYPSDLAYLAEILPSEVKLDPAIDLNFVFGGQMPGEVLISLNFE